MKTIRLLALLLSVFTVLAVSAQKSNDFDNQLQTMFDNYSDGDYSKAAKLGEKLVSEVDGLGRIDSDSLYISINAKLGQCYYRLKEPLKAAYKLDKTAERMRKVGRAHGLDYANMLDNASFYYLGARLGDSAVVRSKAAMEALYSLPEVDVSVDLYSILIHAAEAYNAVGNNKEAITYEIRALDAIAKMEGKLSKKYIDELSYLSSFYSDAGDKKRSADVDAEKEKLQKAYDKGERDLPSAEGRNLKDAAECHKYAYEAKRCADFYLSHKLSNPYMNQCAQYLVAWAASSADVHVVMGEKEGELVNNDKTKGYFVAYIAACVKYALEYGERKFTQGMYDDVMVDVVNFYYANKTLSGPVKYLEGYIKAYKKDKLLELLEKNYPGDKAAAGNAAD